MTKEAVQNHFMRTQIQLDCVWSRHTKRNIMTQKYAHTPLWGATWVHCPWSYFWEITVHGLWGLHKYCYECMHDRHDKLHQKHQMVNHTCRWVRHIHISWSLFSDCQVKFICSLVKEVAMTTLIIVRRCSALVFVSSLFMLTSWW